MKIKGKFAIQQINDIYCAVPLGEVSKIFNGVVSLNETGKRVFECLLEGHDADTVVSALMQEYNGVTENVLRSEVQKVIDSLKSEGLIEE